MHTAVKRRTLAVMTPPAPIGHALFLTFKFPQLFQSQLPSRFNPW